MAAHGTIQKQFTDSGLKRWTFAHKEKKKRALLLHLKEVPIEIFLSSSFLRSDFTILLKLLAPKIIIPVMQTSVEVLPPF